jgi:hypothetical protein
MTNYLLCVLIATVAQGFSIQTLILKPNLKLERPTVVVLMIEGVALGSVLYGLIKLFTWLFENYSPALL